MKAPKSLRRPSNWQDFESLCKMLWGEIWQCPDIYKNGRTGNNQHGVDVYGLPKGETEYYGIQCKGKDEYTKKQFTRKEINDEIKKAKTFIPRLKKLYFATTAVKNESIEGYVRQKNVEHIKKGLFEVYLYSWEDIVDLIDENKRTHDWYVSSMNFKTSHDIDILFQNGSKELLVRPKFKQKRIVKRIHQPEEDTLPINPLLKSILKQQKLASSFTVVNTSFLEVKQNLSYVRLQVNIKNTGSEPIENFKLHLTINKNIQDISKTNETGAIIDLVKYATDLSIDKNNNSITVIPSKVILVGDDKYESDIIYIKPCPKHDTIELNWKLISKNFKKEGILKLNVVPEIDIDTAYEIVSDASLEGTDESPIEDFVVRKE